MTVGMDTFSVERIMSLVEERAKADRKALRERFSGVPLDQVAPDDATFLAWFQMKATQESPPRPIQMPDGAVVVTSPWILALSFADGGDAILRRFERLTR